MKRKTNHALWIGYETFQHEEDSVVLELPECLYTNPCKRIYSISSRTQGIF